MAQIRDTFGIVMNLEKEPDVTVLMKSATFGSAR